MKWEHDIEIISSFQIFASENIQVILINFGTGYLHTDLFRKLI